MPDIVELNLCMSNRTDPQLSFNTRSGGLAIDGTEQILSPLSERWTFSAEFPIFNPQHARAIRVAKSKLKGRFNYLLLRICDQYRISRKDVGATYPGSSVPHSDGAFFSDGSGYALASPKSPIMTAAAVNTSRIVVRASDFNGAMTAGVFFDINYHLYHVDDWSFAEPSVDGWVLESGEWDDDGEWMTGLAWDAEPAYVLDISPPLREAVTTDDFADFDAKSLWRLASDEEGSLALRIGRFGSVTLNLVEPVGR